jgi:hypothetical protein
MIRRNRDVNRQTVNQTSPFVASLITQTPRSTDNLTGANHRADHQQEIPTISIWSSGGSPMEVFNVTPPRALFGLDLIWTVIHDTSVVRRE